MKKRYVLLKESPELKAGAILEERYEDNKIFECITQSEHEKFDDQIGTQYTRKTITESPEWFEEISMLYLTKKQLDKVKKLLS